MAYFELSQWTSGRDLEGSGTLKVDALAEGRLVVRFEEAGNFHEECEQIIAEYSLTLEEARALADGLETALKEQVAAQEARLKKLK
jgi:hypothetical protein